MFRTTLGSLLVLPLLSAAAPAVRSDMLVSTDWLAQHLKDPNIVILQVSVSYTHLTLPTIYSV